MTTTTDELTSPAPTALVPSVLADLRRIPLGDMPTAAVLSETIDRFVPGTQVRQVPVAAFNSSI
jgi:FXSXX-COOH protein